MEGFDAAGFDVSVVLNCTRVLLEPQIAMAWLVSICEVIHVRVPAVPTSHAGRNGLTGFP